MLGGVLATREVFQRTVSTHFDGAGMLLLHGFWDRFESGTDEACLKLWMQIVEPLS